MKVAVVIPSFKVKKHILALFPEIGNEAFAGLLNMDLMNAAYRSIGIDNVEDLDISGEHFFIKTILLFNCDKCMSVLSLYGLTLG